MTRVLAVVLACLVSTGALAQQTSVPQEITGYRDLAVTFSGKAGDCNLTDATMFEDKLKRFDPGFGIEVMTLSAPATERLVARQTGLTEDTGAVARDADLADSGDCPNAVLAAAEVISLPIHPKVSADDVEHIAASVLAEVAQ